MGLPRVNDRIGAFRRAAIKQTKATALLLCLPGAPQVDLDTEEYILDELVADNFLDEDDTGYAITAAGYAWLRDYIDDHGEVIDDVEDLITVGEPS